LNRFCLSLENEDLGVTPIENIFINHYLPRAPGDFVKVYLLGLKYCFNSSSSISNRVIAKTLDLLESDVVKAWTYWEDQNIIRIEHQDQGENLIHFLNIKEVVLNKSSSLSNKKPNTADKIISSRKNKKIKDMHEVIEKMYGRPLSTSEILLYQQWMEDYSFTPELIVLMLEDCFNRGRKEMAYIKQVALNWFNAGVKTLKDAEKYMLSHKEKWEKYFKVMSFLGFKRPPTQKEEEIMDKWFDQLKLDLEVILEACGETAAISQPNFRYVDKIITDWHNKGLTTLDKIKAESTITPKKYKRTPKKSTSKLDLDHNYDMDNLEKKLLKRNRGDLGD